MSPIRHTRREKGISLARGPALLLGTFLVIAGLYFIYMEHGFPRLSQFPNARQHIDGKAFFGVFGLNGWSGELTVAAGGLLLFGAAQHLLAKTASLIVAVVFAGVGIWALVNHHSALGLFAANIWTILLWFAAAALLFVNTLLPRTPTSHSGTTSDPGTASSDPVAPQPAEAQPVVTVPVATIPVAVVPVAVEPVGAAPVGAAPVGAAPVGTGDAGDAAPATAQPPATTARRSADADTSTIIPERAPVRVRPSDGPVPDEQNPASS